MSATEEQRKVLYLQAMDIPLFVSRVDCPGALPTHRVPLPQAAASLAAMPASSSTAAATVTTATTGADAIRHSAQAAAAMPAGRLADMAVAGEPEHEGPATATEQKRATSAATTEAVRFSLVLFKAGRWLWLEETPDGTLASDQVQLVAAMAAALENTGASAKVKPVTSQFKWPPHNNAQFDLGDEAARAGLEAFLQRHVDDSGCTGLIVLGEAAGLRLGEAALSVPVLARTLGTRDMIMQPTLKKQVWSDLKPLVGGL